MGEKRKIWELDLSLSLEQFNVWKSEEKHETQFYQFYQMHEQNAVLLPSTGFFLEQTYDILVIKKKNKQTWSNVSGFIFMLNMTY